VGNLLFRIRVRGGKCLGAQGPAVIARMFRGLRKMNRKTGLKMEIHEKQSVFGENPLSDPF
jgi:hypothetical protein